MGGLFNLKMLVLNFQSNNKNHAAMFFFLSFKHILLGKEEDQLILQRNPLQRNQGKLPQTRIPSEKRKLRQNNWTCQINVKILDKKMLLRRKVHAQQKSHLRQPNHHQGAWSCFLVLPLWCVNSSPVGLSRRKMAVNGGSVIRSGFVGDLGVKSIWWICRFIWSLTMLYIGEQAKNLNHFGKLYFEKRKSVFDMAQRNLHH